MSWITSFPAKIARALGHHPFLLKDDQIVDRNGLAALVHGINRSGGTYHRLDLTPELQTAGDYDMRKYVGSYHIPADLTGLAILDVGTASGYFALECARRGGEVVAIDIWDETPVSNITRYADLPITYVKRSVYDLDASFGRFDVVVCGSLLLHLPDPFGAIAALRRVCRERLCISTACPPDSGQSERPICDFIAIPGEDGNYYTYWTVSRAALRRMLLTAGFARVTNERHFSLDSEEGRHPFATPHVAMSGFVA